jgi:hypothetical protein
MKTSNKILLGIFLAVIILTTSVHLFVYAKYKRGDYVPFDREAPMFTERVEVPQARFVSITGLGGVELINSDTAKFETDKDKMGRISYRMVNDTLVITDSTITHEQLERGSRNYQRFKLYLPSSVPVHTIYTGIMIRGNVDSTKAPSFIVNMGKETWFSMPGNDEEPAYINKLTIFSNGSTLNLEDNVVVNELDLKLINKAHADTKQSEIRKLTLDVDSRSTINLSGNSIKTLK